MSDSNKSDKIITSVLFSTIAALVVLALYLVYYEVYGRHIPKFQVGECGAYATEANEFENSEILDVILVKKVGKENYLLHSKVYGHNHVQSIYYINKSHIKIPCDMFCGLSYYSVSMEEQLCKK